MMRTAVPLLALFLSACAGVVTSQRAVLVERAGGYDCDQKLAQVAGLVFETVLYEAANVGALKRYPPDVKTYVCLTDATSVDCLSGRSLVGCVTDSTIFVTTRQPRWALTLAHEYLGHLVYAEALSMGTSWRESEWTRTPEYKTIMDRVARRLEIDD